MGAPCAPHCIRTSGYKRPLRLLSASTLPAVRRALCEDTRLRTGGGGCHEQNGVWGGVPPRFFRAPPQLQYVLMLFGVWRMA